MFELNINKNFVFPTILNKNGNSLISIHLLKINTNSLLLNNFRYNVIHSNELSIKLYFISRKLNKKLEIKINSNVKILYLGELMLEIEENNISDKIYNIHGSISFDVKIKNDKLFTRTYYFCS
jgi:hypothetical protein